MSSTWGRQLKLSIYGESHGPGVGMVLDGVPAGQAINMEEVQEFMARRSPGRLPWSSARKETDSPRILSGIYRGKTTGTPIAAFIENRDARSADYTPRTEILRPGHADYAGHVRYGGANDPRGGGHFSGRLTAPLCLAGALALQILKARGIRVAAHITRIGPIEDNSVDLTDPDKERLLRLTKLPLPVPDAAQSEAMQSAIAAAQAAGDSLGGSIACLAWGVPAGLGDPIFGGAESHLASLLFGIPAVKAVSFGAGSKVSERRGSQNNDHLYRDETGQIATKTNNDGGINGGITNGMPLVFSIAIKPAPSIALPQPTLNIITGEETESATKGRHDPCIVPRAVPVAEAAMALAVLDLMLVAYGLQGFMNLPRRKEEQNA